MRNRPRPSPVRPALLGLLLAVAGCGALGGSTLTDAPRDWAEYADRTVTVRGTAGNSSQGPIVRLHNGGYIPLATRAPWGIDAVGKPILVTGKVVPGTGFRAEKYILDVTNIQVPPPEPPPTQAPEPTIDSPDKAKT